MSRLKSYAQLVRLPNVFTAFADIAVAMPAVADAEKLRPSEAWNTALCAAYWSSGCLYSAGMVWNDVFDVEQDRQERPFRPIPSGRITLSAARRFGAVLLAAGLLFAAAAGVRPDGWAPQPLGVAVVLACVILVYDAWLKKTWAGPIGMGMCRFLNILLGQSVAISATTDWPFGFEPLHIWVAAVVGLYVVGLTWFARREAHTSNRLSLGGAAVVMAAAVALALAMRFHFGSNVSELEFYFLLVVFCIFVGARVIRAQLYPTPTAVQTAVKAGILGLVILDAALAAYLWQTGALGFLVLILLLPAALLGHWIYST